jgi:acyl dehydratase
VDGRPSNRASVAANSDRDRQPAHQRADAQPAALHIDAEYAAATEFGRIVVNSTFTFALMVGLSVGETTMGTLVANLGFDEVTMPTPVFVGDTLRAVTEVVELRPSKSRPNAGIVTFRHQAVNQKDDVVCDCLRIALLAKRPD